ncbi:talin_middle and talin-RS domain-containing protein rhea isoform X7 [Anticarsia gemmatalis]|uniref:talin_middle and talin-RS domain-containing protein rhea isoform X7 n=1 Tax=Anticarsia gemmatalis TaxID=129554 RepID=UPI003F775592
MAALSLKISIEGGKVVKTIQFDPSTTVYDACRIIREKILEASSGDPKEYGLFLASEEDNKKGIWLEASRSLDYYMLRNGDLLEYNKKTRNLRVRMLDGTVKTLLVDDSQVVANLMVVICTKIGITNYDEYGLVREEQKEEPDPCEKPNYGTLTLKRKHQEKERDAKMEQLRKKLRTDDEVNWVEPSKTLREQGVDVAETLLLRRKLFFSDRNVDSRDPVQLNLLYVQARDAILDGTHPVTHDKACEFAGIQCQIQFGDHREDKHTTGFLDLKEFLPASYVKVKGIEKKIFKEHKKHAGLSELDAKVLYTKSARDLKTYGVAFFLVKEKMKGKNKLVPRLLGVTKDSVLRLDEKTKEILQTWPLTTVRRWCASPNTFTLDFGDYSDQYYSVQTTEAEQILQVIAGYIDIIVRKQRAKEHLGIEGDEGSAMLEDSVSPSKANIIQHDTFKSGKVNTESVAKPAVHRPGAEGAKSFAVGHMTGAQQTTVSGQIITGHTPPAASQMQQTKVTSIMSEPQRALLSTITTGREIIKHTEESLSRASLPALGQDASSVKWKQVTMDTNKQVVTSQIAAMNAATAQVVTLTSGPTEEVDHTAVGAAITTITSNLPEMTKGVQMIAALMDDHHHGDKLLDATRHLCTAFSDLLKAAEPDTKEPRQNLLNAASRVGEASTTVLYTIGEETEEDKETQDILLSLAKAVANTTAALVLKAKNVAAQCRDEQPLQNAIIAAATHCALATSQLVACAKVVAPTLHNPACREQLISAARQVAQAVERLVEACNNAPESAAPGVEHLTAAAHRVTDELDRLLAHCDLERRAQPTVTERSVESVMSASERVVAAADAGDMVRHARLLGQATAHLITNIKTEAEKQPSDCQRKLLAAAKLLADATARMVEAARQCASSPQDREKQDALRKAAEELRYITVDYAQGQDIVGSQVARLQESARQAASSATQLITSAHNATHYNTNKYTQETLLEECKALNEQIPRVVDAVKVASVRPGEAVAQLDLISASEAFLQPSGHVIAASRGALPTVADGPTAKHLADTTHGFTASCADLRSAVGRARISCKGLELDAAAEIIRSLQADFDELEEAARAFELRPLPGQTEEWASQTMKTASRSAASATAALVSGARLRDTAACGRSAAELASALRDLGAGLRASAATHPPQHAPRLITSGRQVLYSSQTLIEHVKTYLTTSETVDTTAIMSIAKDISQGLESTLEAVPSHTELDLAMENINETLNILNMGEFPPSDKSYGELQSELNAAAVGLSSASSGVVGAVERPAALPQSAQHFGDAFNRLLGVSMEMAGQTEDRDAQTLMVSSMKSVTVNSSKLLGTAKSVSQDLTRPNAKNQLAAAARAVTESINRLVDVCTEAAPGQKECSAAIRSIESTRPLLDSPTQPVTELGYFACLDCVVDQSKSLSEGMSSMASSVKRSEVEQFCRAVATVAGAVQGLVECTAQAAYLVAVSDETSVAGRAGLVDQAQFGRAALAIEQACRALSDSSSNQQQVLSAATVIAKHTSALCNACRVASGRTAEPQAKRHFVQAAKDVANSTAALVKEIKALDTDYSEANRARCAAATGPLQDAVRSLCQFADSPEFASIPAKISPQARHNQEAILECGRSIISGSCSMLESARSLALAPTERGAWQLLAAHSKTVSDSIKGLVTNIKEKAPGQRECGAALDTLNKQLRELDHVAMQAVGQELAPRKNNTLQGYSEQIENSATEMLERLEPLRIAANGEAENLGHAVIQLVSYAEPLVSGAIGAASNITESNTQSNLLEHTRTVLETAAQLLVEAKTAAGNPRAVSVHSRVESCVVSCRGALAELTARVRELAAARGAVGPLLDTMQRAIARLTEHRMSLIGSYDETDSFVDYQTRMVGAAKEIARLATDMTAKSATDASRLVQLGNEMCHKYEQLAQDSVGASATTPNSDVANRYTHLYNLQRDVPQVRAAGAGQRRRLRHHAQLRRRQQVHALIQLTTRCATSTSSWRRTASAPPPPRPTPTSPTGTRTYTTYNEMCHKYEQLAQDSVGASATTPNSDVANRIRVAVVELGEGVSELIKSGGHCRLSAIPQNQRAVADNANTVNEKVVAVLSALQAGSRGTQACIDAAATIAAIIGDLDTTILFASAGTLHSEKETDTFSDHRENILKTAKTLVEDTKTLVGGAAGTQEQLATAAQSAVNTIVQLCEVVKLGAMSLGSSNPEPQVLLLHAARDVAGALRDLCGATTAASGKQVAHPDMHRLKHAAKVMVTNVTSLLKTVKAVEDEHTRGTRALESTIEAISQEIEVLVSPTPPKSSATPEELIRCTRQMTVATARAVAAGNANKQDQLTAAANLGRKTVVDLLVACKGAAHAAETSDLQSRTLESGRSAAEAYRALLTGVLAACNGDVAARQHFPELSRRVAHAVADIIATAELLKGSDWVDPDDPTVIAENELLGAAASIDAAAKKLDSLRPRKSVKVQEADESLNFDEMILEAAKSIITATSALVRAASAAQRELIDQGKVARRPTSSSDDGQWSEGLISAARLVAAAAHSLVEAANALVQGAGSEERLISSARQVASSTAQLLVACKVKADPSSESTRRLQAAGAEVIRSTDNLVRAARDAITTEEERSLVLNRRMVGGIAQEIDARSEVLRIEKELEEARGRLTAIRQAKYKLRAGETSGEETDTDVQLGYASDASGPQHRFKTPNSSFANTTYSPNSTYTPHATHNTHNTLNTTATSHVSQHSSHHSTHHSSQHAAPPKSPVSPGYGYSTPKSPVNNYQSGYNQSTYSTLNRDEKSYTVQSPTFSSFRPQEDPKQNYEGFTTRQSSNRTMNRNYETRLYDTPRPLDVTDHYDYKDTQYKYEQKTPLSPKFNARELKFDDKPEPIYSTLKKPFDGVGQTFSEHQKSTEAIPGGMKHSEFKIVSESYSSFPKTEFSKTEVREEVKSPFTSTPKVDRSTELVKAVTPDYDRIASPYGGPNYMEETTTEVKDIPNGTQKITTTKIYSSSPVNLTTTNTKYEPIRLDGIDELSKSFDNDSKYSTLDSRFNTLESKMSSDTSRSFMRPSEFQSSDFQTSTSVTKVKKPSDLVKEIDSLDKKFSKQTITSETIERKSVMTSSHKSETSSTVTKKFGNF